ncbi:DUF4097 and DUF4098 domain-containing protein YvlB [Virgibacillus natechei]|uniref:DUF4097 and DUF4098 domain-containing protein YvlB n=1 Tax=Virgibacillus natechei TaxID=1216297 RepID=A0ABS4IJB1_9BACI|nr:DUF4097 family beta strand repeat-containing protein [Virgibacillus natechei]MBP1970655.1 DUF4097 and DUF4098 domain-containing protein YvlB [Virgibacillus natechei]UZD13959.1 DUF4097 domain-containing protein [Virgibacillus natechei]
MGNVKKVAVVALLLLLIGGLGSIFTFNFNERTAIAETKTADTDNITAIDIRMNNEKVIIKPTEEPQARIELTGNEANDDKTELSVKENGNTLSIETTKQREKLFQFFSWGGAMTLTVYLPEKSYESLVVDIDNGSFQAEQLTIEDINASTNNGEIAMADITAGTVNVHSNNGKIKLDHVAGEINGKTNNGAISLVTEGLERSIDFDTDNGSITIQTDEEPTNAVLDVRVDNGKINIFGDSDWDTVIGNGDNQIKLTTNNGSITVEK